MRLETVILCCAALPAQSCIAFVHTSRAFDSRLQPRQRVCALMGLKAILTCLICESAKYSRRSIAKKTQKGSHLVSPQAAFLDIVVTAILLGP